MKRILPLLFLGLCFKMITAQTVYKDYADGKIYVKFSPTLLSGLSKENPRNIPLSKLSSIGTLLSAYGVTKASKPFYQAKDNAVLPYVLKFEFSKTSQVGAFIEALTKIKGIDYAEKVPIVKTDITPNDPTLPAQLTQINATNAWNVFNGSSNVTLAIVDNAIMWTHQDLVANTYTNAGEIPNNNIDDDGNGYIDDVNGWDVADNDNDPTPPTTAMYHGTHCSGIAGATTDNSTGIASIGWNIKIIPVKTAYNTSSASAIDDGYGGIIYAAIANARVISCSWGGTGYSSTEQTVINYAWNKGCLVVAAAGNSGNSIQTYPGAYANVYCVSSVSSGDIKSSFSNYGTWVDIAAPGENIYSTLPSSSPTIATYGNLSGTSMATPLVAGLAALMLSKCSYMTQTDVINCISSTAVNIYTISSNSTYSTNLQLGAGRIEAYQAMNCAAGFLTIAPVANFFTFPRNTCPSTSLSFHDSSLYAPTSWSWVFQNGTPATSTSSNPSVQWATAGTYSVSLTVSNANGTNTATKTSYITVAGPMALPLTEGFQGTAFVPANWTADNIFNDNIYWARTTALGAYGTSSACAVFDNYDIDAAGERDGMRTPKYIFSNVVSARLRFDVAYARYDATYSDSMEVRLSTDCGTTWNSIYLKGGTNLATAPDYTASVFSPSNTQWRTDTVDITLLAAGQGNVMFNFINRGHYGQPIFLDNINLAFPTPTLSASVPSTQCAGSTITCTNTSLGSASYTWNFPGGSPASSTSSNPSVSFASAGVHSLTLLGVNGTATTSITRTVSIAANPVISVNSPTICSGTAAVLTPTGATNYAWSTGTVATSISVSPQVTTAYTFTGTTGTCSSLKSVTITVNPSPTLAVNSSTICNGGSAVLSPTGAVTYIWNTGSTTPTLLVSPFLTTVYSFTGSLGNCSSVGTTSVEVLPLPLLSYAINTTSICAGGTATLYASGANTYSWSSGATSSMTVVNPTISQGYTVTGAVAQCTATGSLTLLVVPTPSFHASISPSFLCAGNSATLTAFSSAAYTYTSYVWAGPTGILTSTVVSPQIMTSYTVSASGDNGCNTSSVVVLAVNPDPIATVSDVNASCSSCSDGSVQVNVSGGLAPYTYSWSSGSTQPSSTGLVPGCYTITVTDANGCSVQPPPACVSFETGLNSIALSKATLLIYPNPARSQVTVNYQGMTFDCKLYDNLGQLVKTSLNNQNNSLLNIEDLTTGVYLMEVIVDGKSNWKKLLIGN